ncbi:MAG: dihydrodipicolinate synthase family protein, partial [Catalinimonas sp.]
ALLCVSPYYNRPSQEGIARHFEAVADAAPVPLVLYNVPARTASNVAVETTLRLARHPNVVALKEACGDITQALRILAQKPDDFYLLSGDDLMTLPMVLSGGEGVISVLANAFPELFCSVVRTALDGDAAGARAALKALFPLSELVYREGNPVGIKAALALRGIGRPDVRLPLAPASRALTDALTQQIEATGIAVRS